LVALVGEGRREGRRKEGERDSYPTSGKENRRGEYRFIGGFEVRYIYI
jgi:hypothetical protein